MCVRVDGSDEMFVKQVNKKNKKINSNKKPHTSKKDGLCNMKTQNSFDIFSEKRKCGNYIREMPFSECADLLAYRNFKSLSIEIALLENYEETKAILMSGGGTRLEMEKALQTAYKKNDMELVEYLSKAIGWSKAMENQTNEIVARLLGRRA